LDHLIIHKKNKDEVPIHLSSLYIQTFLSPKAVQSCDHLIRTDLYRIIIVFIVQLSSCLDTPINRLMQKLCSLLKKFTYQTSATHYNGAFEKTKKAEVSDFFYRGHSFRIECAIISLDSSGKDTCLPFLKNNVTRLVSD